MQFKLVELTLLAALQTLLLMPQVFANAMLDIIKLEIPIAID